MISSLIDTIKFRLNIKHGAWLQLMAQLYLSGRNNPITLAAYLARSRFSVPGVYGSKATVWSIKGRTELVIECSAPRFLTGQNVFGTENLRATVVRIAQAVCEYLGIRPTKAEKAAIVRGEVGLNRIDLASHLKFNSDAEVEHFLKASKLQLAFGRHNLSAYGNECWYVNQHSDTKTLKAYNKGRQLQTHPLAISLPHGDFIYKAADGLLRVELTLRLRYLERNLSQVKDWNAERGRTLLCAEVEALQLNNVRLAAYEQQPQLTAYANALLAAHMGGSDVETIVPSARALKTHAAAIVEATGINVYVPFVAQTFGPKVNLELLADRLGFGTHPAAEALGITAALPANHPELEPRLPDSGGAGVTAVARDSAKVKPKDTAGSAEQAAARGLNKLQFRRTLALKAALRSKRGQPSA